MSMVFCIDPVGMVYASKKKVRINVAAIIANNAASSHSRHTDFFFFLVVSVVVTVSFFLKNAIRVEILRLK